MLGCLELPPISSLTDAKQECKENIFFYRWTSQNRKTTATAFTHFNLPLLAKQERIGIVGGQMTKLLRKIENSSPETEAQTDI